MAMAPKMSIMGELIAAGAGRAQVGAEQAPGGLAEAPRLPGFHAERLHDAHAGDGLVQDVLDFGQLVLPPARGGAHPLADAPGRHQDEGHEDHQHPSQLAAQAAPRPCGEEEGEELLQEFGQHGGKRVLHSFDVVDDGRQQRSGGVAAGRTPPSGAGLREYSSLRRSVIMPKPA